MDIYFPLELVEVDPVAVVAARDCPVGLSRHQLDLDHQQQSDSLGLAGKALRLPP